jgi:uncharacterized membrane protein YkvA (DUF1232 family)
MVKSSTRTQPRTKQAEKLAPSRSAIAAVVSESHARAEVYAENAKMLQGLVNEAIEKVATLDKSVFKENWAYLLAMLRLLKAYATRRYKNVSQESLLAIIGAVTYFVSPMDLIPDFMKGAGYLDDAIIVRAVQKRVKTELDRFMEWESGIVQ